jgi:hypothetical protein
MLASLISELTLLCPVTSRYWRFGQE